MSNSVVEIGVQVAALTMFLWSVAYRFPKARQDADWFGVACVALTALLALMLFLFVGTGTRSR